MIHTTLPDRTEIIGFATRVITADFDAGCTVAALWLFFDATRGKAVETLASDYIDLKTWAEKWWRKNGGGQ